MTIEIGILLAIIVAMAYLFFTEKLPIEITAFLGLLACVFGGYLGSDQAFVGFASPAVITMLGVFFLGAALLHTGVADLVAEVVQRLLGGRELPLLIAIMVVAGVLSAFMNNIAAVAVLMPAVVSLAKKTGLSASRLLMPLSFGAILGGTTTLVGTPPNILVGDILRERGLEPFELFDFTPIGLALCAVGILYMVVVGRKLLPASGPAAATHRERELVEVYRLDETLFSLRLPEGSPLDGVSLRDTRFGAQLGLQVIGVVRNGKRDLAPAPDTVLQGGDQLLVQGPREGLDGLLPLAGVDVAKPEAGLDAPLAAEGRGRVLRVPADSPAIGRSLRDLDFRTRYGELVVALRRQGVAVEGDIREAPLKAGDELVVLETGRRVSLTASSEFDVVRADDATRHVLAGRLFVLRVQPTSVLAGRTVEDSALGELVGVTVVGLVRDGKTSWPVRRAKVVKPGDELLVIGDPERVRALLPLAGVQLVDVDPQTLESEGFGLIEAVVAPRSRAAGRTLVEIGFRERYGLSVLALWREGKPIHGGLAERRLNVGDALLLQGPHARAELLGRDPDFLVLETSLQGPRRTRRMPVALGGLAVMVALVVTGLQPIHVAAFTAATFVVLGGAITMEEAYRGIEWRAIFLVACVLPIGVAVEQTGAASLLAGLVTSGLGPIGPYAVLAGLVLLTSVLSQMLDGAPSVVLLAPVALETAEQLSLSPYPVMMAIGLAASAAFMTPFSHKANLLVMGAGGYRMGDYLRVGTPLTVLHLGLIVVLVPLLFPF